VLEAFACSIVRLDDVQWYAKKFNLTRNEVLSSGTLLNACDCGSVEILKWLVETYRLTVDDMKDEPLKRACGTQTELVQYLLTTFVFERADVIEAFYCSCMVCNLGIAKLLAEFYQFTPDEVRRRNEALKCSNCPDIKEWLLDTYYKDPPTN
jgi:hypothetical protein